MLLAKLTTITTTAIIINTLNFYSTGYFLYPPRFDQAKKGLHWSLWTLLE